MRFLNSHMSMPERRGFTLRLVKAVQLPAATDLPKKAFLLPKHRQTPNCERSNVVCRVIVGRASLRAVIDRISLVGREPKPLGGEMVNRLAIGVLEASR